MNKQKGFIIPAVPLIVIVLILAGAGIFYLNKSSISTLMKVPTSSTPPNKVTPLNSKPPIINQAIISQIKNDCLLPFSSKYVDLSFQYDSCNWSISEDIVPKENKNEIYVGTYSFIIAKHKKFADELIIKILNTGLGGNYPGCDVVTEVSLINNDLIRIKMDGVKRVTTILTPLDAFHYLSSAHDYAVKGWNGTNGDKKFNEYFNLLNPEAFPNTNVCWRFGGITNRHKISKDNLDELVDIGIFLKKALSDSNDFHAEFLQDADTLAQSIYSTILSKTTY